MSTDPIQTTPCWLLMALVSKSEFDGYVKKTTTSCLLGWRVMQSEDEARGSFLRFVEREKPGFSMDDLTVTLLPEDAMRHSLGLETESNV